MRQGIECERGAYCVAGSAIYTECSAGFFNPYRGMQNETTGCLICNPGHFCGPNAGQFSQTACRPGTFNNASGAKHSSACLGCPPGRFCPSGSNVGNPCPAGTFNSQAGSKGIDDCTPCEAGKFNPYEGVSLLEPDACPRCPDEKYSASRSSTCTPCEGGGITTFTRRNTLATGPQSCIRADWLNLVSETFIIVFCCIIFICGVFCLYCLYLDRKKPGFSHLPLFFAIMSLIEIGVFAWVLSDLVRLLQGAAERSTRPLWGQNWLFPWTQGTFVSFLVIYGLSYVFNFFASHSWTKQVSDDL
jgi:hypothetical protein